MSMINLTLTPRQTATQIKRCLKAGLVPFVRSSPGLGKSEIVHSIAKTARLKVIDFRLSQADVTDLNGLPRFTPDGRAEYTPFVDFPLAGDELPDHPDGGKYNGWLLFFDELNAAPKQLQAAAYKILLERMMGRHQLHEAVYMVAAGNLDSDMAVTHGMSTALQSRLIHIEMRLHKDDWIEWAIEHDVDKRIIAFIEFKPSLLHKFDPNHNDKTFACPRTWKFTDQLIHEQKSLSIEDDLAILAGTISSGVANEFIQFTRIFEDLPKIADIERAPESVPIPMEPSIRFALAVSLADHFTSNNASSLMDFVKRLPVESRVLCLRMVAARKPALIRHPALGAAMQTLVRM